jgi:protein-histidine N-methyltransferase
VHSMGASLQNSQKHHHSYAIVQEEDLKRLQDRNLKGPERLATMLRKSEKDILLSTTDAIRNRLAPIRGIPTKSGKLEDPNADLLEIFETIEGVGSAPKRIWSSFTRWASGKDDPDWKG